MKRKNIRKESKKGPRHENWTALNTFLFSREKPRYISLASFNYLISDNLPQNTRLEFCIINQEKMKNKLMFLLIMWLHKKDKYDPFSYLSNKTMHHVTYSYFVNKKSKKCFLAFGVSVILISLWISPHL